MFCKQMFFNKKYALKIQNQTQTDKETSTKRNADFHAPKGVLHYTIKFGTFLPEHPVYYHNFTSFNVIPISL